MVLKRYPASLEEPLQLLSLLRRKLQIDRKKADLGISLDLILILCHLLSELVSHFPCLRKEEGYQLNRVL